MMTVGDATTWSVTSDNSRGVIYDHNIVLIEATGDRNWQLINPGVNVIKLFSFVTDDGA
jgi:hypothetical protein